MMWGEGGHPRVQLGEGREASAPTPPFHVQSSHNKTRHVY